jgi:hypothetical protein
MLIYARAVQGGSPAVDRPLVIAVGCELPCQRQMPLGRHSARSMYDVARAEGVSISLRTEQRILAEDTFKPWQHRSWIHPWDADLRVNAEVVLSLYEGICQERWLDRASLSSAPTRSPASRRGDVR